MTNVLCTRLSLCTINLVNVFRAQYLSKSYNSPPKAATQVTFAYIACAEMQSL